MVVVRVTGFSILLEVIFFTDILEVAKPIVISIGVETNKFSVCLRFNTSSLVPYCTSSGLNLA